MELFAPYYGTDWIGTLFTLLCIYMLGERQSLGFLMGIAGNLSWIGFGVLAGSTATIVANVVFIGINFRGFMKWGKTTGVDDEVV